VQTSIDPTIQRAAEAALAGLPNYAALVAVRASTGQVLADVSVPAGYAFDQGLSGAFPPGSTFKVITASALIDKGLTPASAASCPPSLVVDGESFHNAEGDAPTSDLAGAFAESCNTAFIDLATADLQLGTLPSVALSYGIGTIPKMGVAAFGGQVPTPTDTAGLAQTAIGQARVLVSPLTMAMVAAAVDSGTVRAPRLVNGAPDDVASSHPLPPGVMAGLQQMMALVVTAGTAAGTGLPAGTHAKTGTAEYGTGRPQPTDAWFVGYLGDVAFAMVLQGTGNGGPTDGPVIARFLTALGPHS
jgi:cell division protein FtsI/penicillin-binding protein 2